MSAVFCNDCGLTWANCKCAKGDDTPQEAKKPVPCPDCGQETDPDLLCPECGGCYGGCCGCNDDDFDNDCCGDCGMILDDCDCDFDEDDEDEFDEYGYALEEDDGDDDYEEEE